MENKAEVGAVINSQGKIVVKYRLGKGIPSGEVSELILYLELVVDELKKKYKDEVVGRFIQSG